ncbi:MAG: hypothetical protein GC162_18235 [Planctomycetes bacterium]|nr:hypothetical protein [Planctomycetota bacterium]
MRITRQITTLSALLLTALTAAANADVITDIGSISLRLKAGDLALSDGASVSAWGSLTQGSAAKQPIFVASDSQFNGQSVVDFDGANGQANGDYLAAAGANVSARTIFVVTNAETGGSLKGVVSNGNDQLDIRLNDTSFYRSPGHGQDGNDFSGAGGTGTFAINGHIGDPYVVNTPHIVTSVAAANQNYATFALGNGKDADSPYNGRFFDGQIAEVIIFNRVLTADENYTVLDYLRSTYAVNAGHFRSGLIGGDSTDPENNGAADANVNYNATFFSNNKPGFGAPEQSFNVFDNRTGPTSDKWCCDGVSTPSEGFLFVGATFASGGKLDKFTVTSSNDTPARDPIHWLIQGSNDGTNWTTVFEQNAATTMWTGRSQTIEFDAGIDYAVTDYFISYRYVALATGGTQHALGELEFFLIPTPGALPAGLVLLVLIVALRFRGVRRAASVTAAMGLAFVASSSTFAAPTNLIVNGEFETPNVGASFSQVNAATVPGWSTDANDNKLEIWAQGFTSSPTNGTDGNPTGQHLELNSSQANVDNWQIVTNANDVRGDLAFDFWQRTAGDPVTYTVTGSSSGVIATGTTSGGSTSVWTRVQVAALQIDPGETIKVALKTSGQAHVDQVTYGVHRAVPTNASGTDVLIDELFNGSSLPTSTGVSPHWFDTTGGTFELYNSSGAGARSVSSTYDHDNDAATTAINIRGGIEVNDSAGQVTLTAELTLPNSFDVTQAGLLDFFASYRLPGSGQATPTVKIVNITDNRTILAATNITFNGTASVWQYNSFNPLFLASDFGDTIQVQFFGGGSNGANGLELSDVVFAVAAPTPAALPGGLALIGLVTMRRRK